METQKAPKLILFAATSLIGWLLPASAPLPTAAQGFSLSMSFISALVLVSESRRLEPGARFAKQQRSFEFEKLANELAYQQQLELDELERQYYPQPEYDEPEYYQPQSALTGGHINQVQLSPSIDAEDPAVNLAFNLDWLLSSNSHHALLCGDTGAGKTILARWLLTQLQISDVTVLDPDDDGQTWAGYSVVGTDDDYTAINQAYRDALEQFNQRTPNDRSLTPKGYVLEELPDHLIECKESEKALSRLLRRGRKRRVFVLAITQDCNKDAIKLSAPLRACFTTFYLQGYAYHALKHLAPGSDRPKLLEGLKRCRRPALVQFKGGWFVWDVPDLSQPVAPPRTEAQAVNAAPQQAESLESTESKSANWLNTIPTLQISRLHSAIVGFSCDRGGWVSVRDVQRAFSGQLKSADEVKQIFSELVGLELGEVKQDTQYDRLLFRSYSA